MKIKISDLAPSLFWHGAEQVLDLDTGEIYEVNDETGEYYGCDLDTGKSYAFYPASMGRKMNLRTLPRYTTTPIYQAYLKMVKEQLKIELGDWFEQAPKFEFVPDCIAKEEYAFLKEAHWRVYNFSDASLTPFADYMEAESVRFAKEWCEKEGYEWYAKTPQR